MKTFLCHEVKDGIAYSVTISAMDWGHANQIALEKGFVVDGILMEEHNHNSDGTITVRSYDNDEAGKAM